MSFSLNFDDIPEYEAIPKGNYLLEVESVEGPVDSNAGNPMLNCVFKVVGGDFDGRKIYGFHLMLGPANVLWRTKQDLEVLLGEPMEGQRSFDPQDLVGSQAMALIVPDVWKVEDGGDGEARPRIRKLSAVDTAAGLFG
jgi:hypothetical protein